MANKTYWAALPIDQLSSEIVGKCDAYFQYLETTGLLRKFQKSYDLYYGYTPNSFFSSSSDIGSAGQQGELSTVKVNNYRNLIQHLLVMTSSSRPALEAKASNTDSRSKAQTILANGILDYYMRDKRLERFLKTACEHSLIWGEGFVDMSWDTSLGEQYGVNPETQRPETEGDISYTNPIGPFDVVRDINHFDYHASPWKIVISRENKYDLAAKYPDKAEQILALSPDIINQFYRFFGSSMRTDWGDLIPVRKFYHKSTDALPGGRLSIVLGAGLWLFDGPMPYERMPNGIPLYRIAPGDFYGSPFGYTSAWDIIGLSEVTDALYSTVVTNQTSFGVQNILAPKGHDIGYQQLTGGLNLIEYDPKLGKPESLNLTNTPQEIFNFIDKLETTKGLMLGVNDVVKGDPQASLKSGSALALVASQAIQFNSGLQASYIALHEDIGTATIRMLQTFANTKRVASIAGKSDRFMIKEFGGDDLNQINRVVVDVTNPLSRTVAGRLEMAKDLLQIPGIVKTPEQYMQVVSTGSFKTLVQDEETALITIDQENEMLQDGQKPVAFLTDDHRLHVLKHSAVLAMPDSRLADPSVVRAVTEHIQEHINILSDPNPDVQKVLYLTKQESLAPQLPPPGAPPAPPPGAGASEDVMQPGAGGVQEQADATRPAALPENPLSGEQFNPETGGLPQ